MCRGTLSSAPRENKRFLMEAEPSAAAGDGTDEGTRRPAPLGTPNDRRTLPRMSATLARHAVQFPGGFPNVESIPCMFVATLGVFAKLFRCSQQAIGAVADVGCCCPRRFLVRRERRADQSADRAVSGLAPILQNEPCWSMIALYLWEEAVAQRTLRFESAVKVFGVRSEPKAYVGQVGEWQISEVFQPGTYHALDQGLGSYTLVLETSVASEHEAWDALHRADELVDEVDTAWCYVCGKPFQVFSSIIGNTEFEEPPGWKGNLRATIMEFQKAKGFLVAASQVVAFKAFSIGSLPLKEVLSVREAYLKAEPILDEVIAIHVQAHKASRGRLFFLAKALELVGRFFGQTRALRNQNLQDEMVRLGLGPHLTKSVEWLFETANTRYEIRHAVNQHSPGVELHPRLTQEEGEKFWSNGDLVVRGFVCSRLGVNIPV
jgi:hypothetical protein